MSDSLEEKVLAATTEFIETEKLNEYKTLKLAFRIARFKFLTGLTRGLEYGSPLLHLDHQRALEKAERELLEFELVHLDNVLMFTLR